MAAKSKKNRKRSVNVCALDDETIKMLEANFDKFDTHSSGALTMDEIPDLIKNSYTPTQEETERIFRLMNCKEDETIAFSEFLHGFYRVYAALVVVDPSPRDFEALYSDFSAELHCMARQETLRTSHPIPYSEENVASEKVELGEEWVSTLGERFASFSSGAAEGLLTKDDMKSLLKSAFTPTEDKIAKVLEFFDMTGGGDGVTRMAFINGMTLLYGDLGHLVTSPTKMPPTPTPKDELKLASPPSMELGGLHSSYDGGYVMGAGDSYAMGGCGESPPSPTAL